MDELTRERFWPLPLPAPAEPVEDLVSRQMILAGYDDPYAEHAQEMRLRAAALMRSRRLARAIRMYQVRSR